MTIFETGKLLLIQVDKARRAEKGKCGGVPLHLTRLWHTPLSKKKWQEWEKVHQQGRCVLSGPPLRKQFPLAGPLGLGHVPPFLLLPRFSGSCEDWSRAVWDYGWSSSSGLWGVRWEASAAVPIPRGCLGWARPSSKGREEGNSAWAKGGSMAWHDGSLRLLALLLFASRAFPESAWTWECGWRDVPLMQLQWLSRIKPKLVIIDPRKLPGAEP